VTPANFVFYSAILGQAPPAGATLAGTANGPDDIQTKEQILEYLRDSFALGHKALATLTAGNAVTPLGKPPIPFMNTRLAMASFKLHARIRSLWANGRVFTDEWNCSADEQGATASESGRPISDPSHGDEESLAVVAIVRLELDGLLPASSRRQPDTWTSAL